MFLVWMTATSFIRFADCYPLNREFDWWCGDQSLHRMLGRASFSLLFWGGICSPVEILRVSSIRLHCP